MLSYYINRSFSRGGAYGRISRGTLNYVRILCYMSLKISEPPESMEYTPSPYFVPIIAQILSWMVSITRYIFVRLKNVWHFSFFLYISVIDEISSISPSKICVIEISKRWISIDDNRRNLRLGCPDLHILPTYSSGFSVSDFSYSFCSGSKLGSSS